MSQRENWYVLPIPLTPSQVESRDVAVMVPVSCVGPESVGRPVESGAITAVCVDAADAVAAEEFFDAETTRRRVLPTSAAPAVYDDPVAWLIGAHEGRLPVWSQRFHW